MTGDEVRECRDALLLTAPELAVLLGVSQVTVWRWESHNKKAVKLGQHDRRMLSGILRRIGNTSSAGCLETGSRIKYELESRGALIGLQTLLNWIVT